MNTKIELKFSSIAALPRLAWCLKFGKGSGTAEVLHGDWVETSNDAFSEGAWAAEFTERGFDSAYMTGTGGKILDDELLLVTPTHTLDRLNILRQEGTMYVSNSLAFLMAVSGEALDTRYPFYDSVISSIKYGLEQYEREIAMKSGARISLHYACNIRVDLNLDIHITPKIRTGPFSDYTQYRSFLDATVDQLVRNAADPRRAIRYAPIATASRGYDSPAAMVIAAKAGCKDALVFSESRGTIADEDNGAELAKAIGMSVREFRRTGYRGRDDFPEILNSGGPNEFLSFGEDLQGRLLFTGFHGDKVWDKNCEVVSEHLVRGDASGSSLTEFRLEVGFFHLPVPFIGADSHPSIHKISNSEEMNPWSLGSTYDRPIPRRIVEEQGIQRTMFGQKKRAAGVVVSSEGPNRTMSDHSLRDFMDFYHQHRNKTASLKIGSVKIIKGLSYFNRAAAKVVHRLLRLAGINVPSIPVFLPHKLSMLAYGYVGRESFLFHWGIEKLVSRYRTAIEHSSLSITAPTEHS